VRVGDSLIERLFGEPVQLDQLADDAVARQLIDRIQTEKQAYFKEPTLAEKERRELRILGLLCELAAKLVGAKRGAVLTQMSAEVPGLFDAFGEGLLTKKQLQAKREAEAELARYDALMEQVKGVYEQVQDIQTGEASAEARDVGALRAQLGLSFIWRLDFAEVFAEQGGFDVVIANPPYVRMEEIKELKSHFKQVYPQVYGGRADLYVYFYHVGLDMLRSNGVLTFISSNKFMRARYGKGLRQLLTGATTLVTLIDFGDLPVFEATTYPSVLVMRKREPADGYTVRALTVDDMQVISQLPHAVREEAWQQPQRSLRREGWMLVRPEVLALVRKLRETGTPLGEYVNRQFYRGVVTGYNKAFVIDQATRDQIVAEDPRSAEIIKPWLRGRDVKRWKVDWQELYIIFTYHGVDIDQYPAIEAYLMPFKERLLARATSAHHEWYELQQPQMGIYAKFDRQKIVYPDIAPSCTFALDVEGLYPDCTVFMIPDETYYMAGILNSHVVEFYYKNISATIQSDYLRFKNLYMEQVPIPDAIPTQRAAIESLVRKLLDAEGQGPQVSEWERELNALVYEVYGLTEEEVGVVEGRNH